MKKNVMLKIASVLMIAVLLTTCAISSTFAKYVSSFDAQNETAHVAKWGLDFDINASGLFLDTYNGGDDLSVKGATTDVVAPGTTNTASITTDISGVSEVAFEVTTVATIVLDGWVVDQTTYCPIIFTVNGSEYKYTSGDLDAFANEVEAAIASIGTKSFAPGSYEEDVQDFAISVSWRWDFEVDTDSNTDNGYENDLLDTKLGEQAAAGNASTVSVDIKQVATQIDTYTPSN